MAEQLTITAARKLFGKQLAGLRAAANLTQFELADLIGFSRSTVASVEAGYQRASPAFCRKCDEALSTGGTLRTALDELEELEREWHRRSASSAGDERKKQIKQWQQEHIPAQVANDRATTSARESLPDSDRLVVPAEHEAMTGNVAPHGTKIPEGFTGILSSLAFPGSRAGEIHPDGDGQIFDQLAKILCEWINRMNRREILQLLRRTTSIIAALTVVSGLDGDEQERLARAIASPSRVDGKVIDHLDAMLRYCKRQDDALGSRAVLKTVLAQRDLIDDLLTECPASLRSRLLSVYSDMSTSIGYYFFDLNDFDSAQHYCDQARAAAQKAGNAELGIYALCEMSDHASWQGRAHAAIDFAAAAQSLVTKTEDPLMRICAAQRTATAYAIDGQYAACMVECESAQDGLTSVGEVPAESLGYFLNEGYLARRRSECFLRLGKPQEAATSAHAGLMQYDKSFVDGYAVCTLHLGNARLQSGEIDEAARVVGNAAGLAIRTRSARLLQELRTTRTRLQPWQDTQAVKELDDLFVAYGLASNFAT